MKVVWVFSAVLVLCSLVAVRGDAKKYDSDIHKIKKIVNQQAEQTETKSGDSEAKAVSDISNLQRLAALNAQSKGTVNVGPLTITGPLGPGGLGNLLAGLIGVGGGGGLNGIAALFTGLFALGAAIAAGFAALVGFIVPPLQIVNQILAIIALALLTAYIVEDKKSGGDYYYEEYDTTGYVQDSGYGYPESTGYSAPASGGGGSSYTSYKRSDVEGNTIGRNSRSNTYRPMINRVARMVNSAVKKYSKMYD